ncbi:MAG: type II toxin-antitoxin system RelE/ParE family toxin [Nitrospirota bacterium]|nr:type II toxin-antitoxin system RelE/ParE family toxin [Nitrospirota bacterium]
MIKTFGDKNTESIWNRVYVKKLPEALQHKAFRKLRMIDAARNITDLKIPPSNRLEKMKGKWGKYHSIRVTEQYRIWFIWENGSALNVEFGDYHDKL